MAFLLGADTETTTTAAANNAWPAPAYCRDHSRAHRNLRMFSTVSEITACEPSEG